jgi:predicted  nucleic acid-binding Zn-ribbon protein
MEVVAKVNRNLSPESAAAISGDMRQIMERMADLEDEARRLQERVLELEVSLELAERSGGYGI